MKQEDCKHEQFLCSAKVFRLTDGGIHDEAKKDDPVIGYSADISIRCTQCGQPFEFIGVPAGVSPYHPTTNVDFTTLRAPLRPSDFPIEKTIDNTN